MSLSLYIQNRSKVVVSISNSNLRMAEDKYNMKNPGVKRILQEVKEMQSNPSDDFMSLPLEVGPSILSIISTTPLFLYLLFEFLNSN